MGSRWAVHLRRHRPGRVIAVRTCARAAPRRPGAQAASWGSRRLGCPQRARRSPADALARQG
eukprot:7444122-Pyramimonas_sp.AAC.1